MTDQKMFCFQCEQTAGCTGCTGAAGVCGKKADDAQAQDEITGALIGLARTVAAGAIPDAATDELVMNAMFTCVTNVSFSREGDEAMAQRVREENARIAAVAGIEPCPDFDMGAIWNADEDMRSLKSLVLFGLRGMAAYAHHAHVLGYDDPAVTGFFYEGLAALSADPSVDDAVALALKVGEVNLACMALLDRANTETYGTPAPADVTMKVEKGPFIIVTGHDLRDLELLLKQTEGRGVNVYTHGEMLPGHAYPELRKYAHLKGNFGTAWQNQRKEFADVPAPILFTTNCLMPPSASYADRVFTTGVVDFPDTPRIGDDKDFSAVIDKAIELGGYDEDREFAGINGGTHMATGFGHGTVLSLADTVVNAVKAGDVRHFFLVGGCDGARVGRNYYTDFVKQTPDDTVVLTLACGKFRFNDLDLGSIGGIPRLLDVGQCNDAYGAVKIALALAEAFDCGVNNLPLTLVLSWYEQKAVCILLTLLHLGIKGIYLGPTLPAFVSPNVLKVLVDAFDIRPISGDAATDMKEMLG
jgi:hydroxylamine reductase